jgi:ribokinase
MNRLTMTDPEPAPGGGPEAVTITVVGSVNLDLVARVPAFPLVGETVTNAVVERFPGGKGGNQALAARRLGANVHLVACLGEDASADEALANVREAGVDLSHCRRLAGESTGLAMIVVVASGDNKIVVAPGANACFRPEHLDLPRSDGLIAQLEVPMETLLAAAQQHEGFFTLNAAPVKPVAPELLALTDLVVVNELEAEAIGPLLADYEGWLAVTYGASGAELTRAGEWAASSESPRVEAIDSVGAGDAFTAALTLGLVQGLSPETALHRACVAGALTTTGRGAQASPTLSELERALLS